MKTEANDQANVAPQINTYKLSVDTCIKAVSNSLALGRKALITELAVCLAIFSQAGDADQNAKGMVIEVYSKAGYDCMTTTTRHYKTVNRRVNASAALFLKIGAEEINKMIGEAQETKMLDALVKGLGEYKFDSMDDVLDFAGKESNRSRNFGKTSDKPSAKVGKAKGKEKVEVPMHRFSVEKVVVQIPTSMSSAAMVKLAAKILSVARAKEQEELKVLQAGNGKKGAGIESGEAKTVH